MGFFENARSRRRAKRAAAGAALMDAAIRQAVAAGWDVVAETERAIREEAGFPRATGESLEEFGARGARVSRDIYQRAKRCLEVGGIPNEGLQPAAFFIMRVFRRLMQSQLPEAQR